MGKWVEYTEEQKQLWKDWVSERPQVIKDMIEKYDLAPEKTYILSEGSQKRFVIVSLHEDGTLTMQYRRELNMDYCLNLYDYDVFNVKPKDLIEVDFPFPVMKGEDVGVEEDDEDK